MPYALRRVTVIVPAHDAEATLAAQLAALTTQVCPVPFEVLVVDDRSTDGTAELVDRWAVSEPRIRRIASTGPRGASHARSCGVAAAEGDLLAFCDADDVVATGWLAALCDAAAAASIVGGRLEHDRLNEPGIRVWRRTTTTQLPTTLGFLPFAASANLAVRRDALATVGGWDAELEGAEDVDLCWRLQLAGFDLVYAPEAVVHYRHRTSLRGLWDQVVGYGVAEARLLTRYQAYGARGRPVAHLVERLLYLLTRLPYLAGSRRRRGLWLVVAAGVWGRLKGSMRYRVWCA